MTSSYLPAPYELAPEDDLAASVAATLTLALTAVASWAVGQQSYLAVRALIDTRDLRRTELLDDRITTWTTMAVGWGVATLLMVLGAISLLRRRGRGALVLGALLSVGATVTAERAFDYLGGGYVDPASVPDRYFLYAGAAAVVAALLPGTKRWITRSGKTGPTVIGTIGREPDGTAQPTLYTGL